MGEISDFPIPLKKYAELYPWPSWSGLRNKYFYREKNGLGPAFQKAGNLTLVKPRTLLMLMADQALNKNKARNEPRSKRKSKVKLPNEPTDKDRLIASEINEKCGTYLEAVRLCEDRVFRFAEKDSCGRWHWFSCEPLTAVNKYLNKKYRGI